MAHPQSSPRGFFAKQRIDVGGAQLTADSTGNLQLNAGLTLSGETSDTITQNSTAVLFSAGIALSGEATDIITQNSTGLLVPSQVRIGGTNFFSANSTGFGVTSEAGLPSTDGGTLNKLVMIVNSTGVAGFGVNTTGTTWKYCRMTSLINTT